MKTKAKKLFAFIAASLCICAMLCPIACASEGDSIEICELYEEVMLDGDEELHTAYDGEAMTDGELGEVYGGEAMEDEEIGDNADIGSSITDDAKKESAAMTGENVFESVYNAIIGYSGEIFSALAFGASLILMLLFKKGLIPLIKKLGSGFCSSLNLAKEEGEKLYGEIREVKEYTTEHIAKINDSTQGVRAELEAIRELIDPSFERAERKKLREALMVEIELLTSILLSSTLPAYQKEEIGNRVCALKRSLGENEKQA